MSPVLHLHPLHVHLDRIARRLLLAKPVPGGGIISWEVFIHKLDCIVSDENTLFVTFPYKK